MCPWKTLALVNFEGGGDVTLGHGCKFNICLIHASSVWNNSVKCNINKVELVRRNAARFTCHDYRQTSSVTAMLQKPQQDSLQQRRARISRYTSAYSLVVRYCSESSGHRYRKMMTSKLSYENNKTDSPVARDSSILVHYCRSPPAQQTTVKWIQHRRCGSL